MTIRLASLAVAVAATLSTLPMPARAMSDAQLAGMVRQRLHGDRTATAMQAPIPRSRSVRSARP